MTREELIEAVARGICRAYTKLHKSPKDKPLTEEDLDFEADCAWDLWTHEAQAALSAIEEHAVLCEREVVGWKTPYFENDRMGRLVPLLTTTHAGDRAPRDWTPLHRPLADGRAKG